VHTFGDGRASELLKFGDRRKTSAQQGRTNIIVDHSHNFTILRHQSYTMAWLQLSEESKERIARVLDMSRVAIH
jgi:hypothetical protein